MSDCKCGRSDCELIQASPDLFNEQPMPVLPCIILGVPVAADMVLEVATTRNPEMLMRLGYGIQMAAIEAIARYEAHAIGAHYGC